jgi:hypothetical protein
MLKNTDSYYLNKEEPLRGSLMALRDIIMSQDDNVTHEMKYGMPFFCYFGKMFCYLWTDKKNEQPYIGFVEGKHLNDPRLEKGSRSRMKILKIDANQDIPRNLIQDLVNEALDLYRNGVVKIKK